MSAKSEMIHANYIRAKLKDDMPMTDDQRNWLIEQTERVHELEDENERLQSEIKVVKYRKGEPTVIDWNGERWIKDSQTTFKGGVVHGKTRAKE